MRSQRAAVVDIGDDLCLIGRDGRVHRLEGDSADLGRAVLAFFGRSRTEAELIAHLEASAGALGERIAVVHQLIDLLAQSGAIGEATSSVAVQATAGANVVVGVCGAIAASSAPAFVTALQRRGHTVEVVLTETATRFVAVEALAAMVQREPRTSMWPVTAHTPVPHVALAQWADLVAIYPASATTIARLAHGEFSELVAAVALTTRAPVVLVPSMNTHMLEAPAVERNLEQLRADGFAIVAGVPSHEVAEAPAVRTPMAVPRRRPARSRRRSTRCGPRACSCGARMRPPPPRAYGTACIAATRTLLPWASEHCDDDLAAAIATHAPPPGRLLDVGCGLGQVARHAVARGYRVGRDRYRRGRARTRARRRARFRHRVGARRHLRQLARRTVRRDRRPRELHVLPSARLAAWAASMRRLTSPGGTLVIKAHRDGVPGRDHELVARSTRHAPSGLEVVATADAELPGLTGPTPIPSILVVLRRRA